MAVTAASLAAALGITVADSSDENDPGLVEAGRLLSVASGLVTAYLRGATDCPEAIQDEAVIRTAGHVQNRAGFGHVEGKLRAGGSSGGVEIPTVGPARSPVRQSGAAALLAPWVKRTA